MTPHEQIKAALERSLDCGYSSHDRDKVLKLLESHTVMPNEPTMRMVLAGNKCEFPVVADVYKAMIQAAQEGK